MEGVDATHHFLKHEDRHAIGLEVAALIPCVTFDLAVDDVDTPVAFMLLDDAHLDALFVDPTCRGSGVGRILVNVIDFPYGERNFFADVRARGQRLGVNGRALHLFCLR